MILSDLESLLVLAFFPKRLNLVILAVSCRVLEDITVWNEKLGPILFVELLRVFVELLVRIFYIVNRFKFVGLRLICITGFIFQLCSI